MYMYATKNRRNGKGPESENEFIINIGATFVNTDSNSPVTLDVDVFLRHQNPFRQTSGQ